MMKKLILALAILLTATGCETGPKLPTIPGVKGPSFNIMDGKIIITLKLLKANLPQGAKVPIPKTRDSSFEVAPNLQDGGTLVTFYLGTEDLKTINIGAGNPNTLPDGRAIPGIAGGTLQNSLRVDTELLDLSFYFHQKLFGFYVPIGWETQGIAGYWNIDVQGKNIGMLGVVASDNDGRGAGVMLFLKLETLKNHRLKRLLKLSEQNPEKMY